MQLPVGTHRGETDMNILETPNQAGSYIYWRDFSLLLVAFHVYCFGVWLTVGNISFNSGILSAILLVIIRDYSAEGDTD